MFEIQKSGDKTSSEEIGLDIRTHASPEVGQDQVSGGHELWYQMKSPVIFFRNQRRHFFHETNEKGIHRSTLSIN